jgi:flagellar protein FliO/FliZ
MRVATAPAWFAVSCLTLSPALATAQQRELNATPPSHYAPVEARPLPMSTQPTASAYQFPPSLRAEHQTPATVRLASAEEPAAASDSPRAPLRLAPRSDASKQPLAKPATPSVGGAVGTVVSSLGVVLGLFLVIAWFSRRFVPAGASQLPKEAVELLGRAPLAGRQQMQLLRVGNKLLLVAMSPVGIETLTEITEAAEVEHLVALCRRSRPGSSQAAFQQVLSQLATEPAESRFAGAPRPTTRGGR